MSLDGERLSPHPAIPEKPAQYTTEQLLETFAETDIANLDAYQQALLHNPSELIRRPLPEEFLNSHREVAPMLMYNVTTKYPPHIEQALAADPIIKLIKGEPVSTDRPRALCVRRSIVAYIAEWATRKSEDQEPQDNIEEVGV